MIKKYCVPYRTLMSPIIIQDNMELKRDHPRVLNFEHKYRAINWRGRIRRDALKGQDKVYNPKQKRKE